MRERDKVIASGPHMMNNKPIIIKAWAANFNFNSEILKTIPLWVKLLNLPLNYWEMETLSRIGMLLGTHCT